MGKRTQDNREKPRKGSSPFPLFMPNDEPAESPAADRLGKQPGAGLGDGFNRSLHPMLVVDEQRRYIDANRAACLFIRMPKQEVLEHRVDDFVAPELRQDIDSLWREFVSDGVAPIDSLWYFPDDDSRIPILLGTASIEPGMQLIVVVPWGSHEEADAEIASELTNESAGPAMHLLTDREREILTLLALGDTGEQIAEILVISPETVRTHLQHVREKLGASTRSHAIALALQVGEISINVSPGQQSGGGGIRTHEGPEGP